MSRKVSCVQAGWQMESAHPKWCVAHADYSTHASFDYQRRIILSTGILHMLQASPIVLVHSLLELQQCDAHNERHGLKERSDWKFMWFYFPLISSLLHEWKLALPSSVYPSHFCMEGTFVECSEKCGHDIIPSLSNSFRIPVALYLIFRIPWLYRLRPEECKDSKYLSNGPWINTSKSLPVHYVT
jgi:hypothetical protein